MSAWLSLLLSLFLTFSPPLVVTISDFHAEGYSDRVEIFWQTASEIGNAGFNLHRATSEAGPFTKINPVLIPGEGDPITPASYQFTDSNVEPGMTYYYKLEAIDQDGQSQWYGPIPATTPAPTATPTSTSTPTSTATPTPTSTATPAPTATTTPTPTGMPTPVPSATPAGYPVASPTTQPSATATRQPPTSSPTRPPRVTASPTTTPPQPTSPPSATQPPATPTATASPSATPTVTATPGPSPTPTPTPFPTVPPPQPSHLPNLCVQTLSYSWLIAGVAVLLVLVTGFVVLMARGRGEP